MAKDIIQKIESLFWENTFSDVSMDEVALKLGMKKASLYYHFTSKEVMFMEVLNYSYEKYKKFIIALFKKDDLESIIS
jgi:AcrR family transcriptional regulator